MANPERPLSPHLQIYDLGISGTLSIAHRITGVINSVGLILLVYWLVSAAAGPDRFAQAQAVIGSPLGQLVLFGWTATLWYHFCNGIRHLVWDTGRGFALDVVAFSGKLVLGATAGLTVLTWIVGYSIL